ncbi:MAG: alanine--glyoxylate aminotransferase family protein [Lachnospiraceae bacterium]|nr:alanine--glyoxylate aminotransferase family protein [Lachnospiraceae bacterium]
MINFTVGPVQSMKELRDITAQNIPYFRTNEFSQIMLENEQIMLELSEAELNSRAVFLTGSGTSAMEAAVINLLSKEDRALVVNGGSFGARFAELLRLHEIPYDEIKLEFGQDLKKEELSSYEGKDYTAFLINACETSSGVLYNMNIVSDFCTRNHLFLIVDAVSSFLADDFSMHRFQVGAMLTASQKALACAPGVSVIVLSPEALKRINKHDSNCMYLDVKNALKNQDRGQTPFTPAVSTLLQINIRLKQLLKNGGVASEIKRHALLAAYFREGVKPFPFLFLTKSQSNAVTALKTINISAKNVFLELKDHYNIWICPNGGVYENSVFRVGHLGDINFNDYDLLFSAFRDMQKRGLI